MFHNLIRAGRWAAEKLRQEAELQAKAPGAIYAYGPLGLALAATPADPAPPPAVEVDLHGIITALLTLRPADRKTIDLCELFSVAVEQTVEMRAVANATCEGGADNGVKLWLSLDYRPKAKAEYLAKLKEVTLAAHTYVKTYDPVGGL